jgi:hypothetical protein
MVRIRSIKIASGETLVLIRLSKGGVIWHISP